MSNKLQEKRSLVRMAIALGQEPAPELLEDIERLEKIEARIKKNIAEDLNDIFSRPVIQEAAVDAVIENIAKIEEAPAGGTTAAPATTQNFGQMTTAAPVEVPATVATQVAESISRQLQTEEGTVVRPDPQMPNPNAALEQKVKYLENWISRIAATGPGGGAASTITLDYPVTTVTTSSYTISRRDHYIGINVAAACTVALPAPGIKAGRNLIIKDESGHCSLNPITITGTIDNDTSGAILAVDNGGLHFIYNNGWRIV